MKKKQCQNDGNNSNLTEDEFGSTESDSFTTVLEQENETHRMEFLSTAPQKQVSEMEGVSPQDVVDKYHNIIKKSFQDLGISFDIYSRTSSDTHKKTASDFFTKLHEDDKIPNSCPRHAN